jgi:hypothetical protein
MSAILRNLLVCAAIATSALPAAAQSVPQACDDLASLEQRLPGLLTACATIIIDRQSLINQSALLPRVIAESFGMDPDEIEPAGLAALSDKEAQDRLSGSTGIEIAPAAETAAAPATRWNLWGDGKYSAIDGSALVSELDGPLWNAMTGLDYKLTDKFTLGMMAAYESSDLEGTGPLPPSYESKGWGAGPYLGVVLGDNIVFSANLLGSLIDSEQSGGFNFDSERLQASTGLAGYWYSGTWRFTPAVTLSWSKEWLEETAGLMNDQTAEVAILTPSLQIGDTLTLVGTSTVEPWAGVALDWTFINKSKDSVFGTIVDDPNTDLRLQAGLNFGFGSNVQLALTGEVAGLLIDETDTYSGEANLAVQF